MASVVFRATLEQEVEGSSAAVGAEPAHQGVAVGGIQMLWEGFGGMIWRLWEGLGMGPEYMWEGLGDGTWVLWGGLWFTIGLAVPFTDYITLHSILLSQVEWLCIFFSYS